MKKIISGIKKVMSNITKNQSIENDNIAKDDCEKDYLNEFINKINDLYNNFFLRIHGENWSVLIKEASANLDKGIVEGELLKFFMDNSNLPYEVWCVLNENFNWSSRDDELKGSFPEPFINYVLANINNEYKLRYDLFKEDINGSYDEFINLYYEAYFAIKNKNLYIANKSISKAKKMFSEHLDLIALEGNYYAEINKVEDAIERLSYIISIDDKYSNAYFDRANIFLRIGKLEKAYEDYHKCLSLTPDNLGAQYELAGCTLNMGYYKESKELYTKLLSMYPNHKEIVSNLNSVNNFIVDVLREKLESGCYIDSEKYTLAQSYFYFGEYEKCFNLIKDIEDSIKPSAEFYLLCGDSLKHLTTIRNVNPLSSIGGGNYLNSIEDNDFSDIEKYYDKAIKLEPNNYKIYYSKGELFYDFKKYNEAIKYFDEVIKLEPSFVKVYLNRAMCLKELNKFEEAIEECDRYIDMDSSNGQALYLKGQCLMGLGKYEDAINYFDKAVEFGDANQEMCYMKAVALHLLGAYRDALQYYEWCLEYTDGSSEIYVQAFYNMGLAVLKLENPEDAYEYFNKAIAEKKDFLPAYGGNLLLLSRSKNYEKCIEVCKEALNIDRGDIEEYSSRDVVKQFKNNLKSYYSYLDIKNGYEETLKVLDEIFINL